MNNFSLFTADRATHLKIVVISLLCALIVAGIGVAARVDGDPASRAEAAVVKAGKPITATVGEDRTIR
jgi:hypothetical protein